MEITRLTPAYKDYIWGGDRLSRVYGKESGLERTAESWELSFHPDGESVIKDGEYAGLTLSKAAEKEDRSLIFGSKCDRFEFFPVLIKLIDAKNDLSVQVHPSDEYALKNEGQFGKTEMWYVIDADEGARLVYGLKRDVTAEELSAAAVSGEIMDMLNFVPVKKGDVFFIDSGMIHAIGKGLLIAEIQQNSNLTYRLYDYGRLGADGKPRELHVQKAAKVSKLTMAEAEANKSESFIKNGMETKTLSACKYFTVEEIRVKGEGEVTEKDTFVALTVIEGKGEIEGLELKAGDTVFIPANKEKATIMGEMTLLKTYID
jgi:mannose-6-phosphate isomerase